MILFLQGSEDAFRYVTFYLYFFLLIGQLVLVAFADQMPYYSPDIAEIVSLLDQIRFS